MCARVPGGCSSAGLSLCSEGADPITLCLPARQFKLDTAAITTHAVGSRGWAARSTARTAGGGSHARTLASVPEGCSGAGPAMRSDGFLPTPPQTFQAQIVNRSSSRDDGASGPRHLGTSGPRYPRDPRSLGTSRPRDLGTSGPRGLEASRPRDLETSGPRDLGTSCSRDLETSRPRDLVTSRPRGPEVRGTEVPRHRGPEAPRARGPEIPRSGGTEVSRSRGPEAFFVDWIEMNVGRGRTIGGNLK